MVKQRIYRLDSNRLVGTLEGDPAIVVYPNPEFDTWEVGEAFDTLEEFEQVHGPLAALPLVLEFFDEVLTDEGGPGSKCTSRHPRLSVGSLGCGNKEPNDLTRLKLKAPHRC